ncbi:MAG: murein biosynthesis integral membrane protein MurJ [Oscillospiraceae bacterium]|nr:murein biosynthesis integral membrane protein MurJ [Oscillospiraceae bacterium]
MINENKKAVKTVSLIIFATAFSKVLGLVRDMILTPIYGGSANNSAITVASSIPLNVFDILFGAAVLGVFIPVYNSFNDKDEKGQKEADEFANIFLNFIILATGLLALIGIIWARQIVNVAAAGYDEDTKKLTADLLRIMLPMIVFTGSVYTATGILQSKGEYLAPALVSSFSNLGVIIYLLFLNRYFGVYGLAVAYLVAWMIQLLTLVVPLIKKRYKYKFKIDFKNPAFIRAIKMTLPILAGSWLVPMSNLIANRFASGCENNNAVIAAFGKSWGLFLIITGILTYGICNYIFPKLAQKANDSQAFASMVKTGLSASFFVIAPVACIAYILRDEAVAVLYMRGIFTPDLARLASQMFIMLTPAMIMFSVIEILNRTFYAKNLVKFPMIAAISGIAVNFALNWVLIGNLKLPPVYITAANFICQTVTAVILITALKIKIKEIFDKKFLINVLKIVLSSAILLIITKIIYLIINNNAFEMGTAGTLKNIMVAVVILIAGIAVYLGMNFILKTGEVVSFIKMYRNKNEK